MSKPPSPIRLLQPGESLTFPLPHSNPARRERYAAAQWIAQQAFGSGGYTLHAGRGTLTVTRLAAGQMWTEHDDVESPGVDRIRECSWKFAGAGPILREQEMRV